MEKLRWFRTVKKVGGKYKEVWGNIQHPSHLTEPLLSSPYNNVVDINLYSWPLEASCCFVSELEDALGVSFKKPQINETGAAIYQLSAKARDVHGIQLRVYVFLGDECEIEYEELPPIMLEQKRVKRVKCS